MDPDRRRERIQHFRIGIIFLVIWAIVVAVIIVTFGRLIDIARTAASDGAFSWGG